MLRKVLLIVVLVVVVLSLTGCQTVQGVGRDITWIGGGSNYNSSPSRR